MEKEKQRLPLLLRSHGRHSEKQSIYNILEDQYFTTCLPVLCNKSVLCSAYGWLVLLDHNEDGDQVGYCCLWNPTTMETIQLLQFEDPHPYNNCVLSKSPTDPDCFIVFKNVSSWELVVLRIGDNTLFRVNSDEEGSNLVAMVSFQGVIYGITQYFYEYEFVIVHMDGAKLKARPLLIDGERPWRIPEPTRSWVMWNLNYLIESPCGNELLLVTQLLSDTYLESSGVHFRVFRVDVDRMECEELESLDGRNIFLSYYGNGFCRSSKCFGTTIKPNSIYYTNQTGMVVYVYDMDDRSTTMLLPCPDADIDPDTSVTSWVDLPENIHKYLVLMSMCSNWGDLTGDLLDLILSKLFGKDRHSFSLVCRHWNTVASISPYRYSPCLMYYYRPTRTWKFYQYDAFLNMSFPELENAELRCSKYGWLLMSGYEDTLFFFDPSNNRKIEVPFEFPEQHSSLSFFNPPTSPECLVVAIRTPISNEPVITMICTLERGDDRWEQIDYNRSENFLMSLGTPVLHGGLMYILGTKGDVATLDIKRKSFQVYCNYLRPESEEIPKEHYLVKVNGEEELFGVFVWGYERKVTVFRLSSSDMKWDLVESIGDNVLYLSHASSFGCKAPTKSMENTIFFPKFHGQVPVFYSLSDGKYRSLNGEYLEDNAYGIRILDFAAWIMPIPAPEVTTITALSWL